MAAKASVILRSSLRLTSSSSQRKFWRFCTLLLFLTVFFLGEEG
jgi:hypothetical protein